MNALNNDGQISEFPFEMQISFEELLKRPQEQLQLYSQLVSTKHLIDPSDINEVDKCAQQYKSWSNYSQFALLLVCIQLPTSIQNVNTIFRATNKFSVARFALKYIIIPRSINNLFFKPIFKAQQNEKVINIANRYNFTESPFRQAYDDIVLNKKIVYYVDSKRNQQLPI